MDIRSDLKEEIVGGCHMFWQKRLSPGRDAGDLSLRDPETGNIYICPMGTPEYPMANWGSIIRDEVVVLNAKGERIDSDGRSETIETPMHLAIYAARPECNAIVHSHGEWSGAFAASGRNVPAVLVESAFIGGEVVCAEYGKVGSVKLASNMVSALGDKKKAALLRNHGAVALGKDLQEAFIVSDFLEKQAMVAIRANSLGRLLEIDINDIRDESRL
jgi:ribulose-5-phosphate 4-epimerase/fuculose-1-phosphate aldolase